MGILSDFVAVPLSEATAVALSTAPGKEYGGISMTDIDPVKLSFLKRVLTGQPYQDEWPDEFTIVAQRDETYDLVVYQIPPEMVALIAAIEEKRIPEVGEEWWEESEEFELDNWKKSDVVSFLAEFRALCTKAIAAEHSVLVWLST
jgi:hypothetical protein